MQDFITGYEPAIGSLVALSLIVLLQSFLGAYFAFVKEPGLPGVPLQGDHSKLGFRAVRTYQNSVENLPAFAVAVIVGALVGASVFWVNLLAILHVVMRVAFWAVYYSGIGKPAGGPRSIVYVIGWAINIVLGVIVLFAVL